MREQERPEEQPDQPPDQVSDEDLPSWWRHLHRRLHRTKTSSILTKVVVTIVGGLVLAVGVITLVTPGPAIVVMPAGLAILATEWAWARKLLVRSKRWAERQKRRAEEMSTAAKIGHLVVGSLVTIAVVAGLVAGYVAWKGWPGFVLVAWDRAQEVLGFLPSLPGA